MVLLGEVVAEDEGAELFEAHLRRGWLGALAVGKNLGCSGEKLRVNAEGCLSKAADLPFLAANISRNVSSVLERLLTNSAKHIDVWQIILRNKYMVEKKSASTWRRADQPKIELST